MHNSTAVSGAVRGICLVYYSDDNSVVPASQDFKGFGYNGHCYARTAGLVELRDGRVLNVFQAEWRISKATLSLRINGVQWSQIQKRNIPSPVSPASIEKIPSNGDWFTGGGTIMMVPKEGS